MTITPQMAFLDQLMGHAGSTARLRDRLIQERPIRIPSIERFAGRRQGGVGFLVDFLVFTLSHRGVIEVLALFEGFGIGAKAHKGPVIAGFEATIGPVSRGDNALHNLSLNQAVADWVILV